MRYLIAAIALALTACGPQYKEERTLIPPATEQGRICAAQCETTQAICRADAKDDVRHCEAEKRDERRDYQRCLDRRKRLPKGKKPTCWAPKVRFCRADYRQCDAAFDACYRRCGGEVQVRRVCVANCQ